MNTYLIYFAIINTITFLLYGYDKRMAVAGARRVSEKSLHIVSIAGGFFGAFIAQRIFRHKTKKLSFQIVYWITVLIGMFFLLAVISTFQDSYTLMKANKIKPHSPENSYWIKP